MSSSWLGAGVKSLTLLFRSASLACRTFAQFLHCLTRGAILMCVRQPGTELSCCNRDLGLVLPARAGRLGSGLGEVVVDAKKERRTWLGVQGYAMARQCIQKLSLSMTMLFWKKSLLETIMPAKESLAIRHSAR